MVQLEQDLSVTVDVNVGAVDNCHYTYCYILKTVVNVVIQGHLAGSQMLIEWFL